VAVPWTAVADGVWLFVRLTPKGGRDAIDGIGQLADGRSVVKVRVAAAPHAGEANDALLRLIAKTLRVPLQDIRVTTGAAARVKRLAIAGDPPTLMAALEKIVPAR
jgi:uncharacterized protein (TIGR00251 family)